MTSSPQRNHAFIYNRKIASLPHHNKSHIHVAYNDSHAMFASSSTFVHGKSRPRKKIMLCIMCLGKCVIYLLLFSMLATLRLYFHVRMKKWLLGSWEPNARETKLPFGFQKLL
jgi:hypothetical protein